MKNSKIFLCVSQLLISLAGFSLPAINISNPASDNCQMKGGWLELHESHGICKFKEILRDQRGRIYARYSECEEWAFFRSECDIGTCAKWNMGMNHDEVVSYCEIPIEQR